MTAAEKRGSARKNLFKCLAARLRIDSKKIVPFQHKKKKKVRERLDQSLIDPSKSRKNGEKKLSERKLNELECDGITSDRIRLN